MAEYTRIPEDQTPFIGKNRSAFELQDEEEQAIGAGTTSAYPPAPAYSGKSILTYTFMSEWNQPTSKMGIMGRTKEETIDIVKETFPELAEYPHHRFHFKVQMDGQQWVEILDSVWTEIVATQPKGLMVWLEDAPGDFARRARRVALFSACFILGFVAFVALMIHISDPDKSGKRTGASWSASTARPNSVTSCVYTSESQRSVLV